MTTRHRTFAAWALVLLGLVMLAFPHGVLHIVGLILLLVGIMCGVPLYFIWQMELDATGRGVSISSFCWSSSHCFVHWGDAEEGSAIQKRERTDESAWSLLPGGRGDRGSVLVCNLHPSPFLFISPSRSSPNS